VTHDKRSPRKELLLVIGGEAGQGLVTIGQLLCKALAAEGYEIVVTQSYHSRIRGGHNTFAIRAATEPIQAPATRIDLLMALNKETVELHRQELAEKPLVLVDAAWGIEGENLLAVPFKDLGEEQVFNVVAFGVLGRVLGLNREPLEALIEKTFGSKKPGMVEENRNAFAKGWDWTDEHGSAGFDPLAPADSGRAARMMLNGNEAIALGALAAGVKFAAFYPMSPATSIMLALIAQAEPMGIIVEQAEDEIAALNMAIGASFAGAPSLVATSGGGFALMTEAVSLAGMTETPVVVVVAQRPGPATGLPTRTEQGDLEFVLHGGHGEFPRIILAPGSVESCFELTRQAFFMAEKYQTPCFVLTDQYLADSYRAVAPFSLDGLEPVRPGGDPGTVSGSYERYAITENGVSPRLLPGASKHLVVADSDEHTSDGHITEDLTVRVEMVKKRLRKLGGIRAGRLVPGHEGPEGAERLLVCWGSCRGSVQEAARRLRREGKSVATLCFEQVWPLVGEDFLPILEQAGEVICVEGNATGQFARLLRRETGFAVDRTVLRYDGLPITPDDILAGLQSKES
jgi:2-oxoglutarate ferredoxin oxidoreductase subunit alpha